MESVVPMSCACACVVCLCWVWQTPADEAIAIFELLFRKGQLVNERTRLAYAAALSNRASPHPGACHMGHGMAAQGTPHREAQR